MYACSELNSHNRSFLRDTHACTHTHKQTHDMFLTESCSLSLSHSPSPSKQIMSSSLARGRWVFESQQQTQVQAHSPLLSLSRCILYHNKSPLPPSNLSIPARRQWPENALSGKMVCLDYYYCITNSYLFIYSLSLLHLFIFIYLFIYFNINKELTEEMQHWDAQSIRSKTQTQNDSNALLWDDMRSSPLSSLQSRKFPDKKTSISCSTVRSNYSTVIKINYKK